MPEQNVSNLEPCRVLLVHNRYIHRGGEDSVVDAEYELLLSKGHAVRVVFADNRELKKPSSISVALEAVWSCRMNRKIEDVVRSFKPDIIHVHNFFPQISPAVFWLAHRHAIPIVQTLHNFRYACIQAMFLRNGKICEDCLNTSPILGVARRCYRNSFAQSLALAISYTVHKIAGTFKNKVARYIALSEFSRAKLIACGLPAEKLDVKPNFIEMDDTPPAHERKGGVFVGRLATEKGISVLLRAVHQGPPCTVTVIGDGPEQERVAAHSGISLVGWQQSAQVYRAMRHAAYLIMPSLCYENFPRTLAEAFACGLPIIASRLGAMAELVDDGRTGLLFTPGSAADLAEKIRWAERHPEEMRTMGQNARRTYEERYTPARNYSLLLSIYAKAIGKPQADAAL